MTPRWDVEVCCACPVGLVCLILSFRREKGRQPWGTDHVEEPVAYLRWCPLCKHNYFSVNSGCYNATDIHELCPALMDLEDKEAHAHVCWKCTHKYSATNSPGGIYGKA